MSDKPEAGSEQTAEAFVLDDLLEQGLGLVFCGTAAGTKSAQMRRYYAHRQNKFWPTLRETGLIPREFDSSRFRELPALGIGLTDIAKYVSGMDDKLPSGSLGRAACEALRNRIIEKKPAFLAFTSLKAGQSYFGRKARFGEQTPIGATRVWVLPSPSTAANRSWKSHKRHWFELAAIVKPHLK
jgi:double-stranded uracil-DNA glycosylase